MKLALLALVLLALAVGGFLWYRNEQSLEAMRRHQADYEARKSYSAKTIPATVTFPRGGVTAVDYWGEMVWKGRKLEIATCSGDTLEQLYAEFDNAPAAFADAEHPLVKIHLGILFDKPSIPGAEAFHAIREESVEEGWRIRHTLVASPHGGLIHPPEIAEAVIAKWPVAPGYVRQPFQMPGQPPPAPTVYMKRFEREQAQRRQEQWTREEKSVNVERGKKHHHFAMVEAIKDLGGGRSVTVRKVGQYLDPKTFERQAEEVKATIRTVKPRE